jgi:hypothetical protein
MRRTVSGAADRACRRAARGSWPPQCLQVRLLLRARARSRIVCIHTIGPGSRWGLSLSRIVVIEGHQYTISPERRSCDSVDTLGDDFRDVRSIEFGLLERRTLGHDFRRTGAVEAIAGGAKAEQLAHAMGNTLSASNALFATYVPVNVTTLREVMNARRRGRSKLR